MDPVYIWMIVTVLAAAIGAVAVLHTHGQNVQERHRERLLNTFIEWREYSLKSVNALALFKYWSESSATHLSRCKKDVDMLDFNTQEMIRQQARAESYMREYHECDLHRSSLYAKLILCGVPVQIRSRLAELNEYVERASQDSYEDGNSAASSAFSHRAIVVQRMQDILHWASQYFGFESLFSENSSYWELRIPND